MGGGRWGRWEVGGENQRSRRGFTSALTLIKIMFQESVEMDYATETLGRTAALVYWIVVLAVCHFISYLLLYHILSNYIFKL